MPVHEAQATYFRGRIAKNENANVIEGVESRLLIPPEQRMEESFRIPIVATLVFILTMVAVFYLGRQVSGYYQPVFEDGGVAFEERA